MGVLAGAACEAVALGCVQVVITVVAAAGAAELAVCACMGGNDKARIETSKFISGKTNDHHIIPKFRGKRKKYADFIAARGIDVGRLCILE